jgi:hypothetical protein
LLVSNWDVPGDPELARLLEVRAYMSWRKSGMMCGRYGMHLPVVRRRSINVVTTLSWCRLNDVSLKNR